MTTAVVSDTVWEQLGQTPPPLFPNQLQSPWPGRLPTRWGTLASLFLVCLVLRGWMAQSWDIVWPDSVAYIDAASALERGEAGPLIDQFGLNVYPLVLVVLHKTGASWETVGTAWSVFVASLAVLPLFGWIRRQFNDQVATLAGLLYAIHPKLMNASALILRDSTFWFLAVLVLYCGWRAVLEIRWRWFLATGLAWTLAIHTRTEGWFLAIPLALWSLGRWRVIAVGLVSGCEGQFPPDAETDRKVFEPGVRLFRQFCDGQRVRMLFGWLGAFAVLPLWLVLLNLTLLQSHPHWVILRGDHSREVEAILWGRDLAASPDEATDGTGGSAVNGEKSEGDTLPGPKVQPPSELLPIAMPPPNINLSPMSAWMTTRKMALLLAKAFTYVFGGLVVLGLWRWRTTLVHGDQFAMVVMNVTLWGAIWFRYWEGLGIDWRYFFSSIMFSTSYMALGLLSVGGVVLRIAPKWLAAGPGRRSAFMVLLAVMVGTVGLRDQKLSDLGFMHQHADLGRWILERYGPNRRVTGCMPEMRLVLYYAQTQPVSRSEPQFFAGKALSSLVEGCRPEIVLLWDQSPNQSMLAFGKSLVKRHPELRLRQAAAGDLPPTSRASKPLLVLLRDDLPE